MGYHEQYYGDDLKPDPKVKNRAWHTFRWSNFKFMTDEQFKQFIIAKPVNRIYTSDITKR